MLRGTSLIKALLILFLIIPFTSARDASAHATPILYSPAVSSTVSVPPQSIDITFDEEIEAKASGIIVLGPDGSRINSYSQLDPSDEKHLFTQISDKGKGTYIVSWQALAADDGHFSKGTFVFSVGTSTTPDNFKIVHESTYAEATIIALEILGQALIIGALIVLAYIYRPLRYRYALVAFDKVIRVRFKLIITTGVLLIITSALAYLLFKAFQLQQFQHDTLVQSLAILSATLAGRFAVYRLLLILIFGAIFFTFEKRLVTSQRFSYRDTILLLIIFTLIVARVRVSHAASSSFHPLLSIIINSIHLIFKNIWTGGLIALMIIFTPLLRQLKDLSLASFILTSFSKLTSICLAIAGTTGIYIIWLHLKDPANLLTTGWGIWFVILSIFAAILLGLRLFQQLIIERELVNSVNGIKIKRSLREVLMQLSIFYAFEMYIGIAVLFVTSVLIITTPPVNRYYTFIKEGPSQGLIIQLTEHHYETDNFLITVQDTEKKTPAIIDKLSLTATNEARGIGPIKLKTEQRFDGGYIFPERELSLPGTWRIDITAQRPQTYDATVHLNIDYPQDLAPDHSDIEIRPFNTFAEASIFGAIAILIFSCLLYRYSNRLQKNLSSASQTHDKPSSISLHLQGSWVLPAIIVVTLIHVLGGQHTAHSGLLQSRFQRICQANKDTWQESIPARFGKATASISVNGCTTGSGDQQFHFADEREYLYFRKVTSHTQ